PWPRSRIVHDVYAGLPESVTIDKIKIAAEMRAVPMTTESGGDAGAATTKDASTDLADLHKVPDAADLIVRLEGPTSDQATLPAVVRRRVGGGLARDAEVEQIEAIRPGDARTSKFAARAVVRRGGGPPGGPSEQALPPLHTVDPVAATAESTTSAEVIP